MKSSGFGKAMWLAIISRSLTKNMIYDHSRSWSPKSQKYDLKSIMIVIWSEMIGDHDDLDLALEVMCNRRYISWLSFEFWRQQFGRQSNLWRWLLHDLFSCLSTWWDISQPPYVSYFELKKQNSKCMVLIYCLLCTVSFTLWRMRIVF